MRKNGNHTEHEYDEEQAALQKLYKQQIGNRITELRMRKDVSESALSQELGKSKGYLQNISSGKSFPSMEMFWEICTYFDMTPQEFFVAELPSPARQRLNKLLDNLSDDDLNALSNLIEQLKQ